MPKRDKNETSKDEGELFSPIANWLESSGYFSLITHNKKEFGMWVADMFPSKMAIEPDVVGIRDSWIYNVCVEAKTRFDEPFEIIGKCLVWQLVSNRVYLAYPKTPSIKKTGFSAVGIGLLEVEGDQVKEVNEPHIHVNQDPTRSELFLKQALNLIMSEERESRIQVLDSKCYSVDSGHVLSIQLRNSGSSAIMLKAVKVWKDKTIMTAHQTSLAIEKVEPTLPLQISHYSFKSLEARIPPFEKLSRMDKLAIEVDFTVNQTQARASGLGEVVS